MFLHAGVSHILFNMLSLWMFGVELERRWGSRFFTKYYFICGIGAGLSQILAGLIPAGPFSSLYVAQTIGASGAIYGILLAYALSFPNRPILIYFIFPVPAKILVAIMGGIFVAEALSVILQVSWFKYTRKRYGEGRRIFLMAPLHHHFEKKGWTETQVVVRFWIITMLLCLVGLSTLKLR